MNAGERQTLNRKNYERRRDGWKRRLLLAYRRATRYGEHRIPPGVRSVLGILLVLGGLLGFLPVLGFWMIPLGIGLLALDLPPLRRWIDRWLTRVRASKRRTPLSGENERRTRMRKKESDHKTSAS